MDVNGPKPSGESSRSSGSPLIRSAKESSKEIAANVTPIALRAIVPASMGGGGGSKVAVLDADTHVHHQADRIERLTAVRVLQARGQTFPEISYADTHKLLEHIGGERRDGLVSLHEWEVNFALLYSAYCKTGDRELGQKIRFLMTNYLQKSAYLNASLQKVFDRELQQSYKDLLQYGQMTFGGGYHRTSDSKVHHLQILGYDYKFGDKDLAATYIPLGTTEIVHLYPLNFRSELNIDNTAKVVDAYVGQFGIEKKHFPNFMKVPLLLDVSNKIGNSLFTDQNPTLIEGYKVKKERVSRQILQIIDRAVTEIKRKYPDLKIIDAHLQTYLLMNTAVVARGMVHEGLSVLSTCNDLFKDSNFNTHTLALKDGKVIVANRSARARHINEAKLFPWSNGAGICLGAVEFRQEIARSYQEPLELARLGGRATTWAEEGTGYDSMMYRSAQSILSTTSFKTLKKMKGSFQKKGQAILAGATVKMMETLFTAIPQRKWEALQEDLVVREVVQNALVRMIHHIGDANLFSGDFRKYSQAIDRVHAELTTILLFMEPFGQEVFRVEYGKYISDLFPEGVSPSTLGVSKSAMRVYSGVYAAVMESNPNPVSVFGEYSYYEQSGLIGYSSLEGVLTDPSITKVDVFTAEFCHNINAEVHEVRYQKENLVHDIKEIFHRKPDTDALTVVVDATLDLIQSDDHKKLFYEFEDEIKEGRINFVVIRSGQKYDMLGLDNYFGAPFYMVNNNDPKWERCNAIKDQKAHQTDPLSNQYFGWMAASSPAIMDDYKKQIYANTREILQLVPPSLKPKKGREVIISDMDQGVSTPFFEISYHLENKKNEYTLMMWMHNAFAKIFTTKGKLYYERGSFGFAHPNLTLIKNKIRINPGLDPNETPLYKEFFLALEQKVKQLKAKL